MFDPNLPQAGTETDAVQMRTQLNALKDHETREGKDVLDIRFLMKENQQVITEDRLRQLCERFAGPDGYKFVRMIP